MLFLPSLAGYLEGEEEEESHHETEEPHSLGEGESQNGIGEELLLKGWVASITDDQGAEDRANTGSRTGHSDGGSSSADELGGRVNVPAHGRCLQRTDRSGRHQRLLLLGRLGQQGTAHRSEVHL